jgi:hypothetical protein
MQLADEKAGPGSKLGSPCEGLKLGLRPSAQASGSESG